MRDKVIQLIMQVYLEKARDRICIYTEGERHFRLPDPTTTDISRESGTVVRYKFKVSPPIGSIFNDCGSLVAISPDAGFLTLDDQVVNANCLLYGVRDDGPMVEGPIVTGDSSMFGQIPVEHPLYDLAHIIHKGLVDLGFDVGKCLHGGILGTFQGYELRR